MALYGVTELLVVDTVHRFYTASVRSGHWHTDRRLRRGSQAGGRFWANDCFAPKAAIREMDFLQCEGRCFWPRHQSMLGVGPVGKSALLRLTKHAAKNFGTSALADAARLSRKQLSLVIGRQAEPRSTTIRLLLQAVMVLEIER